MAFTAKPASVPEFATSDVVDGVSGQNNVIEPDATAKLNGFTRNEKPYRQTLNWIFRFNYLWVNYFNQFFSSTHQFKIDEIIENTTNTGVTIDGSLIKDGDIKVDTVSEKSSGAGVTIDGALIKDGIVQGGVPIGTIIGWLPGYFANSSNGTYTGVAITLPDYWKECDGSALSASDSPLLGGTGHYLPNLTDGRFLMGNTAGNAGVIGGSNSSAHTHSHTHSVPAHYHGMGTGADLNITSSGTHYHSISRVVSSMYAPQGLIWGNSDGNVYSTNTATDGAHTHASGSFAGRIGLVTGGVDGNAAMASGSDTTAASATENRPAYLSVRYIMRVK